MNHTKKLISVIVALAMIISAVFTASFAVGAETSGDFEYDVLDDVGYSY